MQISFNGKKELFESEGFKNKAYRDSGGVWTIGFGTTQINGEPVKPGMTCTREEALQWAESDLAPKQTTINKLVKVPLTQNMFDALCSFVYNIGESQFSGSTLLKLLNQKKYKEAANEFIKWNKVKGVVIPGLTSRRLREQRLFESTLSL